MDADREGIVKEEKKKLAWLKAVVDMVARVLAQQSDLTPEDALELTHAAKKAVLKQFPEKEELYDMIYTSRFSRILTERFGEEFADMQMGKQKQD
ncbi:hypothetical protein ACFLU6_12985 [Acidobacteriota bacterium]